MDFQQEGLWASQNISQHDAKDENTPPQNILFGNIMYIKMKLN